MSTEALRFVSAENAVIEELPWGPHEWMVSSSLTESTLLQMVRVTMPSGQAHRFHRHPLMEEFLYFVSGKAEQWVGEESRILGPGDVAHVPIDVVHGTYNVFDEPVVFLAVLSPATVDGPAVVDMSEEEPWLNKRAETPS